MTEAYYEDHGRHTLSAYNLALRINRLNKHFGRVEVAQIGAALVRLYHGKREAEGVSPGTINLECRTLATALEWGRKQGWFQTVPYIARPRPSAPRERYLTRAESDKLLAACAVPHVRLFILLGLHTGARKGAILGLTWDRVNLDTLTIDYKEPGRAITQKRRAVAPINQTLLAALEKAHKATTCAHVIEFGGGKVSNIDMGFRRTVERAGLEGVSPHVLRHTAATRMAQAGVPLWTAAKILGMSVDMLERVYAHHDPEFGREAVKALEG